MDNQGLPELAKLEGAKLIQLEVEWPTLYFDNQAVLRLECPWRVVQHNKQVIIGAAELSGASTHEEGTRILTSCLLYKHVTSAKISSALHDLQVEFEGGFRLDVFVQSALYESWHLAIGRKQFSIISGGELSTFTQ